MNGHDAYDLFENLVLADESQEMIAAYEWAKTIVDNAIYARRVDLNAEVEVRGR